MKHALCAFLAVFAKHATASASASVALLALISQTALAASTTLYFANDPTKSGDTLIAATNDGRGHVLLDNGLYKTPFKRAKDGSYFNKKAPASGDRAMWLTVATDGSTITYTYQSPNDVDSAKSFSAFRVRKDAASCGGNRGERYCIGDQFAYHNEFGLEGNLVTIKHILFDDAGRAAAEMNGEIAFSAGFIPAGLAADRVDQKKAYAKQCVGDICTGDLVTYNTLGPLPGLPIVHHGLVGGFSRDSIILSRTDGEWPVIYRSIITHHESGRID